MYVLGINSAFHDTAACIVKDGEILVAIEDERLTGKKHSTEYPFSAIRYCLDVVGINLNQVDLVVEDTYDQKPADGKSWQSVFTKPKTRIPRHMMLRHHLGHAAATYYTSGFDDAAILTTDGGGSKGIYPELFLSSNVRERQVFWRGTGSDIFEISTSGSAEINDDIPYPPSIGHMYEWICDLLGYGPLEGPGKIMGLASYGRDKMSKKFDDHYITYDNGHCIGIDNSIGYEEFRRNKDCEFTQEHKDLAFLIQKEIETAMIRMATHLYKVTKSKKLCISGGVALNCVANRKILDNTPFEEIFIFPAASDSGLAVGNALYGYYKILGNEYCPKKMSMPYWGKAYSNQEILSALDEFANKIIIR